MATIFLIHVSSTIICSSNGGIPLLRQGHFLYIGFAILNVPLGMMVGSTLDVLRIANRPLIEKLVNGIGNSGVNIIIESVVGKLNKWFGVDVDYDNQDSNIDSNKKDGVDKDRLKK